MSYKDKVKKAMELIDSTLFSCHDVYYKNRLKKIRDVLEFGDEEEVLLFDLVKDKYNTDVFTTTKDKNTELIVYPFDDVIQVVLIKYIRPHDSYNGDWHVVAEFPHIKTLQQFEDLYKALTGKELGDD